MNILITGGRGQLAKEISRCFERGATEIGVPNILKGKNNITVIDVEEMDITDINAVRAFFKDKGFEAVINCAAYTDVNGCESYRDEAFKVNALGPRNVAIVCEENGAKLIHISTDYIFEGGKSVPYTECSLPNPQSVYGSTKFLGDQYVRDFCRKYFIVRSAWLYGYFGSNFVKTMISSGRKFGKLTVVDDQRGTPTNAADLAHHIIMLIDTEEYGVYHATGAGECSWYEFAAEIIKLAEIDAEIFPCTSEEYAADHPEAAPRPKYSVLDNQMLRSTVEDKFRPWQEALKCFMNNFRETDEFKSLGK